MQRLLLVLLLTSAAAGSGQTRNESHAQPLSQLTWLIGKWKNETAMWTSYETWARVSARTFEGEGLTVEHGDTTLAEFLRIEQFGDEVFYTSKLNDKPYPVPFKLVELTANRAVFEHPEHDFPQRIIYTRTSDQAFQARIEGEYEGATRSADFKFFRVP